LLQIRNSEPPPRDDQAAQSSWCCSTPHARYGRPGAAAQIRQRAELSATRIILLTSGERPGDLAPFRKQRVNARVLKPVQQDELLDTIYR
jgi:hypothetical protein